LPEYLISFEAVQTIREISDCSWHIQLYIYTFL